MADAAELLSNPADIEAAQAGFAALSKAVVELVRATSTAPASGLAWYNLALARTSTGDPIKAQAAYMRAVAAGYPGDTNLVGQLQIARTGRKADASPTWGVDAVRWEEPKP